MTPEHKDQPYLLYVDDEPGIARAIRRILKGEAVNVLTAGGGPEALEILRKQSVSLILTDYRMPEMNGIEFLEQASALCPDAFRMILTGYAEAHVLVEAVNRGQIYKILYKPFQEEDIKLTVRSGLEHHAKNLENRKLLEELAQRNTELAILNQKLQSGLEGTQADLTISSTALGMAQQVLNEIPAAVIGVESSGLIVFANKLANVWFAPPTAPRMFSLVGACSSDVLSGPVIETLMEISATPLMKAKDLRVQVKPELTLQISCRALMNGAGSQAPATTVFLFATEAAMTAVPG
ncbi:MAG: response regulator [Nitrospirota bacterium]|nr:response regulator [Nitrospirota bacterium]